MRTNIAIIFFALLSACGSPGSEVKRYIKCGIAAEQLEMREASNIIARKFSEYMASNRHHMSESEMMSVFEGVRNDDLKLYKSNSFQKTKMLMDVYNSSSCTELHGQEPLILRMR